MSKALRVDEQVLHAYVALENLGRGRPLNELAEELSVSRFTVSRMVRRARELGLVQVTAHVDAPVDIELSARLVERFGLRAAFAVQTETDDEAAVRDAIARLAARYLKENVEEDEVLGLGPGRTVIATSRLLPRLPWVDVVQLTGIGEARVEDGMEAIANAARIAGGAIYPLYAPFISSESAVLASQHPSVQQVVRRFAFVTKAVMTIGGWPDASLLANQLAQLGERDRLMEKGVVAELGAVLLDRRGRVVHELDDRLVGIRAEHLQQVPIKVAVGGGAGKTQAVLAVLRSGLCDVLVTDAQAARAALDAGN